MSKRFGRRGLLGLFAGMAAAAKVAPVEAPPVVAPTPAVPPPPPVVAKAVVSRSSWSACSTTITLPATEEQMREWMKQQQETYSQVRPPKRLTAEQRWEKEGEEAYSSGAYDYYEPDEEDE